MLTISYIVRIFQLVLLLLCGSYFLGMLWYIFCSLSNWEESPVSDHFIPYFGLDEKPNLDVAIACTYYVFTSLSTVGLGDYYPRSNQERFVCAFILLFGVMITSYIVDSLKGLITKFKDFNKSFE